MKVIIIGAGWAGCSAANIARKAGAEVELFEKTDLVLGVGNVGGIMRNNGRFTASEELIALGAGDLIRLCDENATHKNVEFPGHKHATFYNVNKIEPVIRHYLEGIGVHIHFYSRVVDGEVKNNTIKALFLQDGTRITGDVFIDTTGSAGPMGNCTRYGHGCAMCVLRCPSFGPRVSISQIAGAADYRGKRANDKPGAVSGSCKLEKESLAPHIRQELKEKGVYVAKIPAEDINTDKLGNKVCKQYALKEYEENIILLDTGHAKLMTSHYPIEKLRKIKGFEGAKYVDPYAASLGNSVRYMAIAPRDNHMKVAGVTNLFAGGEKSGLFIGHTEAMCTGALAAHNAVNHALGKELLELPASLAIGDIIQEANSLSFTAEGRKNRYTFAGSDYFARMKQLGLYETDIAKIKERVEKENLTGVLGERRVK